MTRWVPRLTVTNCNKVTGRGFNHHLGNKIATTWLIFFSSTASITSLKRYHSSSCRDHFVVVLQKRDKIWYKVLTLIFHQTVFLSGAMPLPHCDWFIVKCVHPAVYQWHDPLFTCSEFCSGCSYPHDFPCEFCIVFELEGLEIVSIPLFFVRLTRSPTWFNMMNDIWPGECTLVAGNCKGWEKLGMKECYGWWSSSFFSLWQAFFAFLHA